MRGILNASTGLFVHIKSFVNPMSQGFTVLEIETTSNFFIEKKEECFQSYGVRFTPNWVEEVGTSST